MNYVIQQLKGCKTQIFGQHYLYPKDKTKNTFYHRDETQQVGQYKNIPTANYESIEMLVLLGGCQILS